LNGNGTEPLSDGVQITVKKNDINLDETLLSMIYKKNAVLLGHRLEYKDELALLEELVCVLRKPGFVHKLSEDNLWAKTFDKPSLISCLDLSITNKHDDVKKSSQGEDSPRSARNVRAAKEIESSLIVQTSSDEEPSSEHSDTLSHIYDEDVEAVQCEGERWEGLSTRDTSPATPRSQIIISSVTPQHRFPQFSKQRKALCSKWYVLLYIL
jgi:hypothetical protein